MAYEVQFSPEAQAELLKLYDDLAPHAGAQRAYDYVRNLQEHCRRFSLFPERGTRRDDIRPGLRLTAFRRRVTIAFHVTGNLVVIDRLFYGGRDVETLLRDQDPETP